MVNLKHPSLLRSPVCTSSECLLLPSLRRLYRAPSAARDEESVADEVTGEDQTTEEALPQTQAVLVQREAQVHQLSHGSQ